MKQSRWFNIVLCFCMLFFCIADKALVVYAQEEITIDQSHFPDETFRNYIQDVIDQNHDGLLSNVEIQNVTEITVRQKNLKSLEGIQYFTALQELYCTGNQLTSLDISQNKELRILFCDENKLQTLDVSQNLKLTLLDCFNNQLTMLDIRQNAALEDLNCGGNPLSSIDTSQNPNLKNFIFLYGTISQFDFSNNPELSQLWISGAPVKTLDLLQNHKLTQVIVTNAELETMRLENMPYLDGANVNFSGNRLISLHADIAHASSISLEKQRAYVVRIARNQTTYDLRNLDANINVDAIQSNGTVKIENGVLQDIKVNEEVSYLYTENGINLESHIRFEEANSWIQPLQIQDWTYGDTPKMPSAVPAMGNVSYSYSKNSDGPFEDEIPSTAGTWYVKATVAPTDTYEGLEAIQEFHILKAKPTFETPKEKEGWKGESLNTVTLEEGFSWQDPSVIMEEAGNQTYYAIYSPKDTQNYEKVYGIPVLVQVKEKTNDKVDEQDISKDKESTKSDSNKETTKSAKVQSSVQLGEIKNLVLPVMAILLLSIINRKNKR